MTAQASPTPLQRLQLREALQDRWRDQVRRITELSVALHSQLDHEEDDKASIAVAISEARLRLAEIEHATRRLDDRSYGRCFACLMTIPISALLDEPAARYCRDCSRNAASGMTSRTAGVG